MGGRVHAASLWPPNTITPHLKEIISGAMEWTGAWCVTPALAWRDGVNGTAEEVELGRSERRVADSKVAERVRNAKRAFCTKPPRLVYLPGSGDTVIIQVRLG